MTSEIKSATKPQAYAIEQVAQHNREGDAWIVLRGRVYDVSKFASLHPAGKKIILQYAGSDATKIFELYHSAHVLPKYHEKLYIGYLKDYAANSEASNAELQQVPTQPLFSNIPYADPSSSYQGWSSPYHTEMHKDLRKRIRTWAQREIYPNLEQWAEGEVEVPPEMFLKVGAAGFLALCVGKPWPREWYPDVSVAGLQFNVPGNTQDPDVFCEQILYEEIERVGGGGVFANLIIAQSIGLPPILHFGSRELQQRVAPPCLRGEKRICLAVTEPWAGSDVANIRTTAVKSACGKYYIVNGMKKWITTALYADFFSTAVRTGGPGHQGLSFLLVPRNLPGVTTRRMKCQGWWASGTTFLVFENVQVPVENLIGQEGDGFKCIMHNFNHERLVAVIKCIRLARNCLEEAMRHAHRRETFGKRLIDHQVIRLKLANMIRQIESVQAYVDQICYNFQLMDKQQHIQLMAGALAIAKVQVTQTMEFCTREASQIFGGLAYTRGGLGGVVERGYREVRVDAIGGGSEEVMLDLGARNASKLMPKQ